MFSTPRSHQVKELLREDCLMIFREVSFSVKDCYSRPNRAAKLRSVVHEILVFFHMLYEDLKDEYVGNTDTYLHLMSDLLSVYLDLEIKVSK